MVKVTRAMISKANRSHERTETLSSLERAHALSYLYAKQHKDKSGMMAYRHMKKKAEKIEKRKKAKMAKRYVPVKKSVIRKQYKPSKKEDVSDGYRLTY